MGLTVALAMAQTRDLAFTQTLTQAAALTQDLALTPTLAMTLDLALTLTPFLPYENPTHHDTFSAADFEFDFDILS